MNNRTYIFLMMVFFASVSLLAAVPQVTRAQDTQSAQPQAAPGDNQQGDAQQGGDGAQQPGGGGADDPYNPFRPRMNARARAAAQAPKPPLPADAPQVEKSGNDVIVHAPGGDITIPNFLEGMAQGEQRPVNVGIPGHGNCVLQIDSTGVLNTMTCER